MLQAPTGALLAVHVTHLHLLQASARPAGLAISLYSPAVRHTDSHIAWCCSALAVLLQQFQGWPGLTKCCFVATADSLLLFILQMLLLKASY